MYENIVAAVVPRSRDRRFFVPILVLFVYEKCPARRRLEDAMRILQEKAAPAVAVIDAAGRLVGLVTRETVGEMLMVL